MDKDLDVLFITLKVYLSKNQGNSVFFSKFQVQLFIACVNNKLPFSLKVFHILSDMYVVWLRSNEVGSKFCTGPRVLFQRIYTIKCFQYLNCNAILYTSKFFKLLFFPKSLALCSRTLWSCFSGYRYLFGH